MKGHLDSDDMDDVGDTSSVGDLFPRPNVPPHLEERVTRTLADAGLINVATRRTSRVGSSFMWRIAAGIVLFVAGFGAAQLVPEGDGRGNAASSPGDRYALLFYPGRTDVSVVDDVAANRSWAHDLVARGHEVSGEKLRSGGVFLTHPEGASQGGALEAEELQGFFVVSAASQAEAVSIAKSSPHYLNGGRIVVTLVDPT